MAAIPCSISAALYLSVVIIDCAANVKPSVSTRATLNNLISAAFFTTFVVTLLTTVLIAYQIYSFTRRNPRKGITQTFKDIAEVLVQSAAAYSLVVLWGAIMGVIPQADINETAWFVVDNYAGAVIFVTAVRVQLSRYTDR